MLSVTPSSSLAAPSISQRVHSLTRPNMVSGGTIVWLSSELMFFAGLFAMFFTVKAQHDGPWPPVLASTGEPIHLDVPYALVITIVLVASSFTCQWGVFKAEQVSKNRWHLEVKIASAEDIDPELLAWLRHAYELCV